MELSSRIRMFRERSGLTQDELASKIGRTRPAVTAWEAGRSIPRMPMLEKLASIFGVTVSDLMGEGPENPLSGGPTGLVPLVATSHMGDPADDLEPDFSVRVPQEVIDRHPGCFAVHAEGGCMDKRYPDDCIIVMDPHMEPRPGDAVMARFPDGRSIVRAYMPGSALAMLSPDSWSGEYEDIVIHLDDDPVELAGVAVWYMAERDVER